MDLEKLRRRLPPHLALQLDALHAEFLRQHPKGRGQDFARWLQERHLVDSALLRTGTDQLELSTLDSLKEHTPAPSQPPLYQTLAQIGSGSVGQILRVKDRNLRRQLALKQIHPEMVEHPQVLSRFLTEAQITAQLDHPGIIPVYSLEMMGGNQLAYSMKLVQGMTLKDLLREARIQAEGGERDEAHSLPALLDIFLKICDALDYAHSRGVIHRDLKPANIMIGPFHEVYIMDWGIARRTQDPDQELEAGLAEKIAPNQDEPLLERTQIGQVLGTPRYMSPEQAAGRNEALDGRSDQFSLGLLLYELVTLRPAFQASNSLMLLQKVLKAELEPIPERRIPPELKAIIARATQLEPARRYASVRDMATDIRRFLRGEAVSARPDTPVQKTLRWMGRHWLASLSLSLLIFLACMSALSVSLWQQQQTQQRIQAREHALFPLLNQLSRQRMYLIRQLMAQEALLEGLSAPATAALRQGQTQALLPLLQQIRRHSQAPEALRPVSSQDLPLTRTGLLLHQGELLADPPLGTGTASRAVNFPPASDSRVHWRQDPDRPEVLFLTQSLLEPGPRSLGTAFAELRISALQDWLKPQTPIPHLLGLYLLNSQGELLAQTSGAPALPTGLKLPLPVQTPGYQELQTLVSWQPLPQGWILVAQVNWQEALKKS